MFNLEQIRAQFPVLNTKVNHNYPLVFLDTAASSQKPLSVINGMRDFYLYSYANIHRGDYPLSEKSSTAYEQVRHKVKNLINASSAREIIFTKNTTESINLVANSLADGGFFQENDRIILSEMEHHANIVPWLQIAKKYNLIIDYIPLDKNKNLDLEQAKKLLEKPAKFIAITHVSNVLGTINEVSTICKLAKAKGVLSLIDGAQAISRLSVDVQEIDCDFYAFSGHKMYGPSGVGVLYGHLDLLKQMPPFLGGGMMIKEVSKTGFISAEVPDKFEAGTPPIAEVYGLGLAIDFMQTIGISNITTHDKLITDYAYQQLSKIPNLKIYSNPQGIGLVSFKIDNISDFDLGDELGEKAICLRVGQHCAQPLLTALKVNTVIRASFGVYTSQQDVDILVGKLKEINGLHSN